MADLTDPLYDRAHELGKRIVNTCAPTNPMRSPSTRSVLIRDLEPLVGELYYIVELIKRHRPT